MMDEVVNFTSSLVTRNINRIANIEQRNHYRLSRVQKYNANLEHKLHVDIQSITRQEEWATKRYLKDKLEIQDELRDLKKVKKSDTCLLQRISSRNHQRRFDYDEIRPHTAPRITTKANQCSPQKLNKLKEDILGHRDKKVHFNKFTFTHAIAVNNVSNGGGGIVSARRSASASPFIRRRRSRLASDMSTGSEAMYLAF